MLGTTARNADGSGILPRTGGDILWLVLWAFALALVGTVLVRAAGKRGLRYTWLRLRGHRPVPRSDVLALPPPEVPFVDTSRFVPYRSPSGDSRDAPTTTGWDEPRNDSLS